MKKTVIFAIDGASINTLNEFIGAGLMPTLSKLIKIHHPIPLTSSTPPATFPAWMNFLTGVGPGKHGVVGLINLSKILGMITPLSGLDRKSAMFPEILDKIGVKALYINLPGLFPPDLKHAKALASFLWAGSPNYSPSGLIEEIPEVADYKIVPDFLATSIGSKDSLDEFMEIERNRFKLAKKLCEKTPEAEVIFYMISAFDWFFHKVRGQDLKDFINKPKARELIREFDSQIRWFWDNYQNEDFLIMSDHGEKRFDYKFYANKWLIENKYIRLRHVWYKKSEKMPLQIKFFIRQILESNSAYVWIIHIFQKYPLLFSLTGLLVRHAYQFIPKVFFRAGIGQWGKELVPEKSLAYFGGYYIRFNGTIEQKLDLIKKLKNLTIPNTTHKVFSKVLLREEAYSGEFVRNCPEIILEWDSCVCDSSLWAPLVFLNEISYDHQKEGIFISNFKKNIKSIKIEEISSIILKKYESRIKNQKKQKNYK